jgi:hypothetical protein
MRRGFEHWTSPSNTRCRQQGCCWQDELSWALVRRGDDLRRTRVPALVTSPTTTHPPNSLLSLRNPSDHLSSFLPHATTFEPVLPGAFLSFCHSFPSWPSFSYPSPIIRGYPIHFHIGIHLSAAGCNSTSLPNPSWSLYAIPIRTAHPRPTLRLLSSCIHLTGIPTYLQHSSTRSSGSPRPSPQASCCVLRHLSGQLICGADVSP